MIIIYIIGAILMIIAQFCFMFKVWFNVEGIGSLAFLIGLLLIIPAGIIGGWNRIWIYLLIITGATIVGLLTAGAVFRFLFRKHHNAENNKKKK